MLRLILAASETEPATAVSIAAVTFSEPAWRSAARTLAVSACFFTNSRAASGTSMFWSLVNASVTGAKASLTVFSTELVSVVIGVSQSSGLSYGLTPSGLARGEIVVPQLIVQRNMDVASRYHEYVIRLITGRFACGTGVISAGSVLDGPWEPVGFHLGPDLRHIMSEDDDVVLLAVDVPDVVAQQRFGLEAKALEQRDGRLLVDRHLHRELFEAGTKRQRK